MVRRGRPLMRAAMVGGLAYHAGKNVHQDTAPAPVGAISDAAITQLRAALDERKTPPSPRPCRASSPSRGP